MDNALTLHELMEQYEAMHVELSPLMAQMNDIKKEIVKRVKDVGAGTTHGRVTATLRSGYTRATWDGKALNGYAAAHPEILDFRTERQVGPSVSIKVV